MLEELEIARKRRPKVSQLHGFQPLDLLMLVEPAGGLDAGTVVMVEDFRGDAKLRVRSMGGMPFNVHYSCLERPGQERPLARAR